MPSRRTHQFVGTLGASGVSLLSCGDLPQTGKLVYCLSAALGGFAGGTFPDTLEPAVHSCHRGFFHSGTMGTGVVAASVGGARTAGAELRATAARLRAARFALPPADPRRFALGLRELLIYIALGFSIGFAAGYVTHIVADMDTPRGVPIISRSLG